MKGGISKKLLRNRTTKKQHVLLLFLLSSTLFWFLTKLSKVYETKVVYNINYVNLPSSKLFQNTPSDIIEVYVKSTGFKLLREGFNSKKINIGLKNVKPIKGYSYYLLSNSKSNQIQKQLNKDIELIGFVKDTLFFELGFKKEKKVPVLENFDFNYKSGYNLSNKIFLIPDSIVVSGPESQVNKITSVTTKMLEIDAIVEDVYVEIPIVKVDDLDKVNYNVDKIQVVAEVEKFTEDSFDVPFTISGLPIGTKITTYPNNIKVVFQVGLSNYNKISANDFKIVCNYVKSDKEGTQFLVPELVTKPSLVSAIKLIPNRIEYLIQK